MFRSAKRACKMSSREIGARRRHETTHFMITMTPSYIMRTVFKTTQMTSCQSLLHGSQFISTETRKKEKQSRGLHELHVSHLRFAIYKHRL